MSPSESLAWSSLERQLRSELSVRTLERRARFGRDRALLAGIVAVAVGATLGVVAALAPIVVVLAAGVLAGAGLGTVVCRVTTRILDARRA